MREQFTDSWRFSYPKIQSLYSCVLLFTCTENTAELLEREKKGNNLNSFGQNRAQEIYRIFTHCNIRYNKIKKNALIAPGVSMDESQKCNVEQQQRQVAERYLWDDTIYILS